MLQDLLSQLQMGSFGPIKVLSNLLMALVLSLLTTFVYRKTHSGYAYSRSFNITMVSVAMVVTMMMMVIANYLALSLGLIGALSVIRFRSAIKDSKDMAFLFICIAIGLACSTGDYVIAVIGTVVIDVTLLVLHFLRLGTSLSSDHILTFILKGDKPAGQKLMDKAKRKFPRITFRSYSQISDKEGEFVYALSLGKHSEEETLRFFRAELPQLMNISLIAPEANVEI